MSIWYTLPLGCVSFIVAADIFMSFEFVLSIEREHRSERAGLHGDFITYEIVAMISIW
jgi:hypothetical protein